LYKLAFLVILSGVIAYIGDILGKKIGKKRLTLFNLRPRQTAAVVTIATGILITITTVILMALLFDNVWIALFEVQEFINKVHEYKDRSMKLEKRILALNKQGKDLKQTNLKLKTERDEIKAHLVKIRKLLGKMQKERKTLMKYLNSEISSLKKERSDLIQKIERLEKEIKKREESLIVFSANTPILIRVIPPMDSPQKVYDTLKKFLKDVRRVALKKGAKVRKFKEIWDQVKDGFKIIAEKIYKSGKEYVVAMVTDKHIFKGEELSLGFKMQENKLIFKANEQIVEFSVSGRKKREEIANIFSYYIRKAERIAISRGRLEVGEVDTLTLYDMVETVYKNKADYLVRIKTKNDTYTAGPFVLFFELIKLKKD